MDLGLFEEKPKYISSKFSRCGGGRTRTYSVRDNRFTVCPGSPTPARPRAEFWVVQFLSCWQLKNQKPKTAPRASRRTRTADQLITNQLLYQLSYTGLLRSFFWLNFQRTYPVLGRFFQNDRKDRFFAPKAKPITTDF